MKFTYSYSVTIPKEFLTWLKKNGFKRVGKSCSWKKEKGVKSSADFEIVKIVPTANSYQIFREYWGKAWSKSVYAYDTQVYETFYHLLSHSDQKQ